MSESLRITSTLLTVMVLTGLLGWYVVVRTRWAFGLSRRVTRALGLAVVLGIAAAVLSRALNREHDELSLILGELGGTLMLAVVISAALLLPVELALWLVRGYRALRAPKPAEPASPARREFVLRGAAASAITLGTGASVYGTWFGRHDYTLETVPIRLAKLPRTLDGLSIVQLSDVHVGTFVGERELAAALSLVRDAKPDLIVMTGDLLDHDASYAPTLARFARSLQGIARFGVHAIPGNHDHYAGAQIMMDAVRSADTNVLLNRHVRIGDAGGSFVLAGLDDVQGPRFSSPGPRLDLAFQGVQDDAARVLLSHNPSYFHTSHRQADLTLSGHTHGGQITLFINPAKLVLRHGLVRGHYAFDGSQLYVNRGFGTAGPPSRVGSPPEVTKIVLHV